MMQGYKLTLKASSIVPAQLSWSLQEGAGDTGSG